MTSAALDKARESHATLDMLTDDSLHGRVVLSSDGVHMGEVTHLVLDPQGLRVAALEVRLHKDVAESVGLARGILRGPTIQIPTEQVQSIGDAIILAVPAEALRGISSTQERDSRTPTPDTTR